MQRVEGRRIPPEIVAQRNKIYQTLAKQTILGCRMKPLLVSKEGNATKVLITVRDTM